MDDDVAYANHDIYVERLTPGLSRLSVKVRSKCRLQLVRVYRRDVLTMAAVAKELSESVRQYSGGEVLEAPVFTKLPDTKHLRVSVTEVPAAVLRRLPEI